MILKLDMHHQGLKVYKVSIIDDPWLTLTYFMARPNYFQTSSSLKLLGQLKPNCMWSLLMGRGGEGLDHMSKMAAMLIYGKNL